MEVVHPRCCGLEVHKETVVACVMVSQSDIMGVSARQMLEAMLDGQRDAEVLAQMARGKMRDKQGQRQAALHGRFTSHHAFWVSEVLAHIDYGEAVIERINAQIEERLRPFEADIQRLDTIPGINRIIAQVLFAEIGHDGSRFPTDKQLASWVALCPGHDQSAGHRRSGKTRAGNRWLRQALVEAAQGARLARRRGSNKAIFAVAHSILVVAYPLPPRKRPIRLWAKISTMNGSVRLCNVISSSAWRA